MDQRPVILITKPWLGTVSEADRGFGTTMLDKFLHSLESAEKRPGVICFFTEGVRVVCEGSPHLASLRILEGLGVRMLICGSCLEYYGLQAQVDLGEVGGIGR